MTANAKERITALKDALGPGLITGAADDDPSGIATYSIAGAQFGNSLLWTAAYTWPLMFAVQLMCARVGMVTGEGLTTVLKKRLPKLVIILFSMILLVANTINVAADLSGMADAAEIFTGISAPLWVGLFGILIAYATVEYSYNKIASALKWLVLVLLAYVGTAILSKPSWSTVLSAAFIPSFPSKPGEFEGLLAIFGTTISPYLFYWQTSEEVEEEEKLGRNTVEARKGATSKELLTRTFDVGFGTFLSNAITFCIILAASSTLFKNGIHSISTSKEAALALEPIAGGLASALYALGIIGLGFLAIPTLTASAAYALAETFGWEEGLDRSFKEAHPFYSIIIISTISATLINWIGVNPFKLLYFAAVLNGIIAPFLLIAVLWVASDKEIMQNSPIPIKQRVLVGITTLLMFGILGGMIVY